MAPYCKDNLAIWSHCLPLLHCCELHEHSFCCVLLHFKLLKSCVIRSKYFYLIKIIVWAFILTFVCEKRRTLPKFWTAISNKNNFENEFPASSRPNTSYSQLQIDSSFWQGTCLPETWKYSAFRILQDPGNGCHVPGTKTAKLFCHYWGYLWRWSIAYL